MAEGFNRYVSRFQLEEKAIMATASINNLYYITLHVSAHSNNASLILKSNIIQHILNSIYNYFWIFCWNSTCTCVRIYYKYTS